MHFDDTFSLFSSSHFLFSREGCFSLLHSSLSAGGRDARGTRSYSKKHATTSETVSKNDKRASASFQVPPRPKRRSRRGGSPRRSSGARRAGGRPGWTRRVVANFGNFFDKISLVFGCIGTDLCKQIRVLQHFSKSTRLSS